LNFSSFEEVAIKMIRANEIMSKTAQKERIILNQLALTDPENKRHIIRLRTHFEYHNHVCLVFEPMDLNLRMCIRKFGREIGLNIHAVRAYTIQLLIALKHLKNNGVLHADIKPDNILVNETRTVVKLCDFGSAMLVKDNEATPYLVSRFYRAPEVILGVPYDYSLDMWSIGCVIFELFTGQILFPGKTNDHMIKLMMTVKGPMPKKMLRIGIFAERHFNLDDSSAPFIDPTNYPIPQNSSKRIISNIPAKKNFISLLSREEVNKKKIVQMADLLDKMLTLVPEKRLTPIQALKHVFCEVDQIRAK
jgi:serine/threonine-protein kinase PRP4